MAQPRRIGKVVSATPSPGTARKALRPVTDAKRCENLAYRFEEAEGQERYPLEVAHLKGSDYFGCDLLSFATSEDRELFRSQSKPDENLVLRFIEVKGRGSEKGAINLEGNELAAARNHLDRFYLYRIYEIQEGEFEVVVLNDPLADNPEVMFKIDLFREARTTRWKVEER